MRAGGCTGSSRCRTTRPGARTDDDRSGAGPDGRVAEALPRFEEAKRVAIKSGDGYELGRYYGNLASALDSDGQSAVAREVAREGIEAMARFGLERSLGANLRHNLATDESGRAGPLRPAASCSTTSSWARHQVTPRARWSLARRRPCLAITRRASAAFERARWLQRRGGRIVNEADLSWNLAIQATWLGDIDGARRCIDDCHRLVRPNDHELRVLDTSRRPLVSRPTPRDLPGCPAIRQASMWR